MAVTVRDILDIPPLKNAEIRCGRGGFGNLVSTATVMNILDIKGWLKENELLLTAFPLHMWLDESALAWMRELKIPALITKAHFASGFSDKMLKLMDDANIPLIIMDASDPFSDILHPIMELVISDFNITVSDIFTFQRTLVNTLRDNESLDALCENGESALHRPIAIVNLSIRPVALVASGPMLGWDALMPGVADALCAAQPAVNEAFEAASLDCGGLQVKAVSLKYLGYQEIWLLIKDDSGAPVLSFIERMLLEQLALVTAYALIKKTELESLSNSYYNVLVERLLAGQISDEEIAIIGIDKKQSDLSSGRIALINIDVSSYRSGEASWSLSVNRSAFSSSVKNEYAHGMHQNILYSYKDDRFYAWINKDCPSTERDVRNIMRLAAQYFPRARISAGISGFHNAADANRAYKEAQLALNIARESSSRDMYNYDSLGIVKFFNDNSSAINRDVYAELTSKYIAPLIEYDKRKKSSMLHTLDAFLANRCSPTRTAEVLFIHKNTLLARMERIQTILGISLDDPDSMLEMQLALKFHKWSLMK